MAKWDNHNSHNASADISYPLVNQQDYGKSHFFVGKSTINGHFQ